MNGEQLLPENKFGDYHIDVSVSSLTSLQEFNKLFMYNKNILKLRNPKIEDIENNWSQPVYPEPKILELTQTNFENYQNLLSTIMNSNIQDLDIKLFGNLGVLQNLYVQYFQHRQATQLYLRLIKRQKDAELAAFNSLKKLFRHEQISVQDIKKKHGLHMIERENVVQNFESDLEKLKSI